MHKQWWLLVKLIKMTPINWPTLWVRLTFLSYTFKDRKVVGLYFLGHTCIIVLTAQDEWEHDLLSLSISYCYLCYSLSINMAN